MRFLLAILLLAIPAQAELIKPNDKCGPAIPRESVKVLDISTMPDDAGQAAVQKQFGAIQVVSSTTVQARTAFGHAWKRAEKEAAEMGCPYVVLLQHGKVLKGLFVAEPIIGPIKRDSVVVLYAKPAD